MNKELKLLLNCEDDKLLKKINLVMDRFSALPKNQKYQLAFSGGKDSHALLGLYVLWLKFGNKPLDLIVSFSDTRLEALGLYELIDKANKFCDCYAIPFERLQSLRSFWYYQFVIGYPVPFLNNRWCTIYLKIRPQKKLNRIPITGRHEGESKKRDKSLKLCGSSECGIDLINKTIDPISNFTNCDVWDFVFLADGVCLYENSFNLLQFLYKKSEDNQSGSLRMGCVFCPIVKSNTIKKNVTKGITPDFTLIIRNILEEIKDKGINIRPPKRGNTGAIYIETRRHYWNKIKPYLPDLLVYGWITEQDIKDVEEALKNETYPPTYSREWIEKEHKRIEEEKQKYIDNPFWDLPLFNHRIMCDTEAPDF